MGRSVRTARRTEIAECAQVLAEAFADDPLMAYIWPAMDRRTRLLPRYFDASIRFHHIHGGGVEVATDDDDHVVGVAVWDPPGLWQQSIQRTIRAAPRLLTALQDRLAAAVSVRRTLDREHPSETHWYLANIGTTIQVRGTGCGTALLLERLAVCDQHQLPAYLVCTREENVEYYERFEFGVTSEFRLPNAGPPLWSMWRPAR